MSSSTRALIHQKSYSVGFIRESRTSLETDGLPLWSQAGLLLSDDDLVLPNGLTNNAQPIDDIVKRASGIQ